MPRKHTMLNLGASLVCDNPRLAMRGRVDVTALSHGFANFQYAYARYQSVCSRTSATTKSLNILGGALTPASHVCAALRPVLSCESLRTVFQSFAPLRRQATTVPEWPSAVFCPDRST